MVRTAALIALLLGGCASQVMKSYVGLPLQTIMAKRGPPMIAFDLPDGRRAFQCVLNRSYQMPTTVTNTGQAYPVGNQVWWTQNTQISGGQVIGGRCAYTLYGRWSDAARAWMIEGFEKPPYACE